MTITTKPKVKLSHLAAKWPSSVVTRDKIEQFTGGLIKSGRMANLDYLGQGPRGRMRIGRKVAYPVDSVVEWLESRAEEL